MPALPIIQVAAGNLSGVADRGEQVLREAGVPLYQRAGKLVRAVTEEVEAAQGRKTRVAQFCMIDVVYMRDLLSRNANWQKFDSRRNRWVAANPPPDVAATIMSRTGEWGFATVVGVVSTPTMRPDGSLMMNAGYDPATRLLLVDPPPMPDIPDQPTREDAFEALRLLESLLIEFPLVDDVARSVALSGLITPVVRGAFLVAPMHVARAPVAASGKSFLFDVVSAIAIGQRMPVMAAGRTEEETEKRLGAALLAGQPLISIDNVNGELTSDALCQIIERPVVDVRILGRSERVRIEARGTTMFCTGNNIVLVGDLCRRSLTATLDPKIERPELREFVGDPVETVLADRGKYVAACLTLCRAYIVAGRPGRAKPLASFEGWSDVVRSALIWLGKADPVDSIELARTEDPELGELGDLLSTWSAALGVGYEYRCKLQEVINKSIRQDQGELVYPELLTAVKKVAARRGVVDIAALGRWAQRRKGRIVDGLFLSNNPRAKGASEWWVQSRDGVERAPERVENVEAATESEPNSEPPY